LPQVAADYHILPYFHDLAGVFVNLYLPSTLRWVSTDGAQLSLAQTGDYPVESNISLQLRASRPSVLSLRLRIPAWASAMHPMIRVNGQRTLASLQSGFATLHRTWKDGDRIDLTLPLPVRVDAIDPEHPDTLALLRGPLVLFAIGDNAPAVTRQQLLSALRVPQPMTWRVETASGPRLFRPFTAIQDERYSAYVNVT
jgi:hypothetical protein